MVSTPRRTPATRPARDLPRSVRTDKANRTLALEAFPDAVLQSMCPLLLWGRRRPKNQSPLARAMCGTDRPGGPSSDRSKHPCSRLPFCSRALASLILILSPPAAEISARGLAEAPSLPSLSYTLKKGHLYTLFSPCACEASEAILPRCSKMQSLQFCWRIL